MEKKNLSLYVQIVPWKEKLDTGGYVLRCDTATNGSQCLKHLTVLVLSSLQLQDRQLLIPKAVCYKDIFQKKGIFRKETNKKKTPTRFTYAHLQTLKRMLNAAAHIFCLLKTKTTKTHRRCWTVGLERRGKKSDSSNVN